MANTLTGLIPTLYEAGDIVEQDLVGAIGAVSIDTGERYARAGKDQTVRVPIVPSSTPVAITPGLYAPNAGDQTLSYADVVLDQAYSVPIRWNGEEQRAYGTNGQLRSTFALQVAQAVRALRNQIEADICEKYVAFSRAYGTAGTAPFASTVADAAAIRKILDDNGAPQNDRSLIINTTAGLNLRGLTNLITADAAGTDVTLRNGGLLNLFGLAVRESAQIQSHTKGAGTGYDINNGSGEAVGQTTITLDGGTVNTTGIKAGDVVTFAGDTNKYIVTTGLTATSGDIVIAKPGLRILAADTTEMTIGDSYTANLAFHREAIKLVQRMPAMPEGGDAADDAYPFVDPVTGLTFEIRVYKQYHQVYYEVAAVWGVKVVKPEYTAILLG